MHTYKESRVEEAGLSRREYISQLRTGSSSVILASECAECVANFCDKIFRVEMVISIRGKSAILAGNARIQPATIHFFSD